VIAALLFLGLGIALLYIAGRDDLLRGHDGLRAVLDDLGGVFIASVALGALWELAGKRSFAREVLDSSRVTTDVVAAGLRSIGTNYLGDPDWERLFADVQKLDVFFAYGRTWRNSNDARLKSLAARRTSRIRVFLPDPTDSDAVCGLADRFQMSETNLRVAIEEARDYFTDLGRAGRGSVSVFYRKGESTFSCYRFDKVAILTLYTHSRMRTQVPTIVCEDGGSLYDFIRAELRAIEEQSSPA
jgi:hypothetical protein